MAADFPKSRRVCSPLEVGRIFNQGKSIQVPYLRVIYLEKPEQAEHRVVVSVPKRLFKRAVKRNLLKRRIREAFRLQQLPLKEDAVAKDILWVYTSKEIVSYECIRQSVQAALELLS